MRSKPEMTWEKSKLRWRKMYKGKIYTITCQSLGVPQNKDASTTAANSWWKAKQTELDADRPRDRDYEEAIGRRQAMLSWMRLEAERLRDDTGLQDLHDRLAAEVQKLEADAMKASPPRLNTSDNLWIDPLSYMRPSDAITWLDRLAAVRYHRRWTGTGKLAEDQTVGGQVKAWVAHQEARVHAGDVSPGQHENLTHCLFHFRDFIGADQPLPGSSASTLGAYYLDLASEVRKRRDDPAKKAGKSPRLHRQAPRRGEEIRSLPLGEGSHPSPP